MRIAELLVVIVVSVRVLMFPNLKIFVNRLNKDVDRPGGNSSGIRVVARLAPEDYSIFNIGAFSHDLSIVLPTLISIIVIYNRINLISCWSDTLPLDMLEIFSTSFSSFH